MGIVERSKKRRNLQMPEELLRTSKSTEARVRNTDELLLELLRETRRGNLIALASCDLLNKEERMGLLREAMPETFAALGDEVH